LTEMVRSVSKRAFVENLRQLVPEVNEDDLLPAHSGVRAQALMRDGTLVDDFLIVKGENSMHVCNAPSPAATASLEIGRFIASRLPKVTLPRHSRRIYLANQQIWRVNAVAGQRTARRCRTIDNFGALLEFIADVSRTGLHACSRFWF